MVWALAQGAAPSARQPCILGLNWKPEIPHPPEKSFPGLNAPRRRPAGRGTDRTHFRDELMKDFGPDARGPPRLSDALLHLAREHSDRVTLDNAMGFLGAR